MLCAPFLAALALTHPWPSAETSKVWTERIAVPEGYQRVPVAEGSFGAWLRTLPARSGRPSVRLYNGKKKARQDVHLLVFDVDVGKKDLQQCADAVIRLYAEYQHAKAAEADLCFKFTSGDPMAWSAWKKGVRPRIRGSKVKFSKRARASSSYENFRSYLDMVFMYAGTASLARDTPSLNDPTKIEVGDFFLQGGYPGHAVLVVDVVQNEQGDRMFAVAQSYMPAQEFHLLKGPDGMTPWYPAKGAGILQTPEWSFAYGDLHRMPKNPCKSSDS